MKMLSLSFQPVAAYIDNPSTSIRPWKLSKSTCFSGPLNLSCKSMNCSEPPSNFGGLNGWSSKRDSLTGTTLTHAKRKSSKPEVVVKEPSPIKYDILAGLNEISNEAVKAMTMHDSKKIEELKETVDYLEQYLVEEGENDAAKFMSIIAGMLDHMVPAEKDELNDAYKAALKKMWNIIEDSGWILKFENEEKIQEMVDDDLIPPVLNKPY